MSNLFAGFMDLFDILIPYIDITFNHFFLEPYEEKTSYTFLGGGII